MPRKTIAGLEAVIAEKDAEIAALKTAGGAPVNRSTLNTIALAIQTLASRRLKKRIRVALGDDVVAELPPSWNFLRDVG